MSLKLSHVFAFLLGMAVSLALLNLYLSTVQRPDNRHEELNPIGFDGPKSRLPSEYKLPQRAVRNKVKKKNTNPVFLEDKGDIPPEGLIEYVKNLNEKEEIHNLHLPGPKDPSNFTVIVVMVHTRLDYLETLIDSLRLVKGLSVECAKTFLLNRIYLTCSFTENDLDYIGIEECLIVISQVGRTLALHVVVVVLNHQIHETGLWTS
jgi:hypothetical protein